MKQPTMLESWGRLHRRQAVLCARVAQAARADWRGLAAVVGAVWIVAALPYALDWLLRWGLS